MNGKERQMPIGCWVEVSQRWTSQQKIKWNGPLSQSPTYSDFYTLAVSLDLPPEPRGSSCLIEGLSLFLYDSPYHVNQSQYGTEYRECQVGTKEISHEIHWKVLDQSLSLSLIKWPMGGICTFATAVILWGRTGKTWSNSEAIISTALRVSMLGT